MAVLGSINVQYQADKVVGLCAVQVVPLFLSLQLPEFRVAVMLFVAPLAQHFQPLDRNRVQVSLVFLVVNVQFHPSGSAPVAMLAVSGESLLAFQPPGWRFKVGPVL